MTAGGKEGGAVQVSVTIRVPLATVILVGWLGNPSVKSGARN